MYGYKKLLMCYRRIFDKGQAKLSKLCKKKRWRLVEWLPLTSFSSHTCTLLYYLKLKCNKNKYEIHSKQLSTDMNT